MFVFANVNKLLIGLFKKKFEIYIYIKAFRSGMLIKIWFAICQTWCKTEQFWQFTTVASAAIATILDWLSPGIMVIEILQQIYHPIKQNKKFDTFQTAQFKTSSHFAYRTFPEVPMKDPKKALKRCLSLWFETKQCRLRVLCVFMYCL